jgi:hypothetical protein
MRVQVSFVLAAALIVLGSDSWASAHRVSVEKQKFVGKQASTSFSGSATITCADGITSGTVTAFGSLSGSESITKDTGAPKTVSNGVFVEVDSYFNECTGASIGFADGGITNGFTPPNKRLNSAELEGTTSVQDFGTGDTVEVAIDVVIEGTGPLTASKSVTKTKTVDGPGGPVTITINKTSNANRSGVASGTVAFDGVQLDVTFDATVTTLLDNATTDVTIEKK